MKTYFEEPPIDGVTCKVTNLSLAETPGENDDNDIIKLDRQVCLPPGLVEGTDTNCSGSIRDDESSLSDGSIEQHAERTTSILAELETDSLDNLKIEKETAAAPTAEDTAADTASFVSLRITYLIVTLVVMLADGLQGTHLYVLYEGYGFTVANLYCLGFLAGGLASPITGPLVDKLGRKKSAILYCILEIMINRLEQYPALAGLIISRMVGGITTNLLSTVFDTWLDTEYRRRGIRKQGGYETIMRDSVIISNLAAIGSGYLAHTLAEAYGPKGPFEGAVVCTSIALIVIMFFFTENYGCCQHESKGMKEFMSDAVKAFKSDSRVLRLGIIQGLTCGSIQIFIFLWSPALRQFAISAPMGSLGLDGNGEPAYGLIFGGFMAAGVMGGLSAPTVRRFAASIMGSDEKNTNNGEQTNDSRPMTVEALSTICYLSSAALLLLPCLLDGEGKHSFSICLGAFLVYEFIVGMYLPWEGVLRSIYFPAEGRASILTLPRLIVNGAVSCGVVLTNYMTMGSAFSSIVVLMVVAAALQLSLIESKCKAQEWNSSPEITRASFMSATSDDETSLSSDSTKLREKDPSFQKVKGE